MSAFAPARKQRVTTTSSGAATSVAVSVPPSSTTPAPQSSEARIRRTVAPPDAKGKIYREMTLAEVKEIFKNKSFLRPSDTKGLHDTWLQPVAIERANGMYTTATFLVMMNTPTFDFFYLKTKVNVEDVLAMLYLCDCMIADFQGIARFEYNDWLNEKTSAFVKVSDAKSATNQSLLVNYILNEDKEFTFYPDFMKNAGFFVRKLCYHQYKGVDGKVSNWANPSMLVREADNEAKFKYVIEGRCFSLPDNWWMIMDAIKASAEEESEEEKEEEVPSTQPMDI